MAETSKGDPLEIGKYGWQMGFGGEKTKVKICFFLILMPFIPLFFFSFSTLSRTSNIRVKEINMVGIFALFLILLSISFFHT